MKSNNTFLYILALVIVLGFFAMWFTFSRTTVPKENIDVMMMIVGAAITAFATVIAYFFGSSAGSAKKDETINNQSKPNEKN